MVELCTEPFPRLRFLTHSEPLANKALTASDYMCNHWLHHDVD